MAGIWSNPEFVRQRRAELRPGRAMTAAAVVVLMCILAGSGMLEFAAESAAEPATRRGAVWNAGMDSAAGCFPAEFCAQHMAALFSLAGWIAGRSPDVLGIVFVCPVGIGRARSQDVGFSADNPAYRGWKS